MESAFLGYLAEEGKAWFSIEDAYGAFPDKSEGAVRFMLMRMLEKGLLIKVSKKAYWVVPFDQNAGICWRSRLLEEAGTISGIIRPCRSTGSLHSRR